MAIYNTPTEVVAEGMFVSHDGHTLTVLVEGTKEVFPHVGPADYINGEWSNKKVRLIQHGWGNWTYYTMEV